MHPAPNSAHPDSPSILASKQLREYPQSDHSEQHELQNRADRRGWRRPPVAALRRGVRVGEAGAGNADRGGGAATAVSPVEAARPDRHRRTLLVEIDRDAANDAEAA